ncbi:MAG: ATP-binding protein [Methanobrevibacter sp.]|nr:ATP-binding protein [Candidatus Methanovirga basalitermitum]
MIMKAYISTCIGGIVAFDKNLKIIDYESFKDNKIHLKIIKNLNKEILKEEIDIINRIVKDYSVINIESNKRISDYKTKINLDNHEIIVKPISIGGKYLRENLEKVLLHMGFENENMKKLIVETLNKVAKLKMKESSQEEDKLLIQSINAIDEIDEAIGKLTERIREWYAIYFPEMEVINKNDIYIKLIADVGNREEIIENHLKEYGINVDVSNGADIEIEDLKMIKGFGKSIKSLQKSREAIEEYIDIKMDKISPNLKNLIGSSLGAKLIAHVGSLKKLALYPSGTIQILGAEKALFRHLKTGENPPKHGIIYQHPDVRSSKWWVRGKISRALALKISLSVRKDFFNGKLDEKIKEEYIEKVEKIRKENPFPKKPRKKKNKKKCKKTNRKLM